MPKTIFDSAWLRPKMRKLSLWFFTINDWEIGINKTVTIPCKCVISAVPHTTWKDLPYTIMLGFVLNLHIRMMAKEELFFFPFKSILLWLGCTPIKRGMSNGKIKAYAEELKKSIGPLQLVFPPAGTREMEVNTNIRKWKTGFYFTAKEAGVPIVLFYVDYKNRKVTVGKIVTPTDDFEVDMQIIHDFYKPFFSQKNL
jgi:1-acyl-sn-glycerol-3-phosphate acyltransferase